MYLNQQTLLLSEALSPGSCGSIAEFLFALISKYVGNGGRISMHKDEKPGIDEFEEGLYLLIYLF